MSLPEHPVAMGVIRSYETDVYEDLLEKQIANAKENEKIKTIEDLLNSGQVFDL
jgi:2-oxoglutarate ferredoxin oxidoreductase subunit beta